jgi:hypothetical protein
MHKLPPGIPADRKHCPDESFLAQKPLLTQEAIEGWDAVLAQILEGRDLARLYIFLLL